jgi:serine/arginine repetitive matrix protein 2
VSFLRFDLFCLFIISPTIVPERIPIRDDDNDYDDADDIHEPRDRSSLTPHHSDPEEHDDDEDDDDDSLPRAPIHSKNIVVDIETSPEAPKPSQIPPSPSSGIVLSNDSRIFPARLSISSPSQPELPSPNTEYMGWEDSFRVIVTDATPKKNGEGSQSKWGRVKNAFSRPGSSAGKRPRNDSIQERGNNANSSTLRSNGTRSRNNSIRDRATNTDSSISRESGASLTGASKTDKGK